jgi:hypothetical protein
MGLQHGTTTGYSYYKCRCQLCRDALNEYQRKRAKAKKEGTWQPGQYKRGRQPCSFEDCDQLARYLRPQPLCNGHIQQWRNGQELKPLRRTRRWKNGLKECRVCGEVKGPDDYYARGERLASECKQCTGLLSRAQKYGLTVDEVVAMMERPCDVCGVEVPTRLKFIDHCHKTGDVRGVLCHKCNTILMEHVTPELLRRLAAYLENL